MAKRQKSSAEAIVITIRDGLVRSDIGKAERAMNDFVGTHDGWKKKNYSFSKSKKSCTIRVNFKDVPYEYKAEEGKFCLDKDSVKQLRGNFLSVFGDRITQIEFTMLFTEVTSYH